MLTGILLADAPLYWAGLDKKRKAKGLRPEWGKWVLRHLDKDSLNQQITAEHDRVKRQVADWQQADPARSFTPGDLAERFRTNPRTEVDAGYLAAMQRALLDYERKSFRTWQGKKTALNALTQFVGREITLEGRECRAGENLRAAPAYP